MKNDSMYFTMYNESIVKENNQRKAIENLKVQMYVSDWFIVLW